MSTTVRIPDEDRARLHRLQDAWRRLRGEPPTQLEIVHRALQYVERNLDAFLAEAAWVPLSPDEIARRLPRPRDLGPWSTADIDDTVYGG